ncbi:hypothetical protein [Nonlabens xiamenensis]|uniref:hypothetical protein n=1 Tax=Nonlabens xiamenensis TaxID=2341043 RepID=UPI000F614D93|nr:hypothetical protein [Nonlabens xiamenensis]
MNKLLILSMGLLLTLISAFKVIRCDSYLADTDQTSIVERYDDGVANEISVADQETTYRYVSARSGLNYRVAPQGKILGKFDLNRQLKIVRQNVLPDTIKDGNQFLVGNWVGVEIGTEIVYVFDAFLQENPVPSDLALYYLSAPYVSSQGEYRTAFLNISEAPYFEARNNYDQLFDPLLSEEQMSNDTIILHQSQRKEFLQRSGFSDQHNIFIYELQTGQVSQHPLTEFPMIACLSIYTSGDGPFEEYDYQFGFDLGKHYQIGENLVAIASKNPFVEKGLQPMVWEMTSSSTDIQKINNWLSENNWFPGLRSLDQANLWKHEAGEYICYVQEFQLKESFAGRLILAFEQDGKLLHVEYQRESESAYLIALNTEKVSQISSNQFTGRLFKEKGPILFGLISYSFGCPAVKVLDRREPNVPILCDNRH